MTRSVASSNHSMSIEAPLIGEKLLSNAWPVKVALGEEDAPGSIAAGAKLGSAHCRLRAAGCAIRGYESVGTRLECRFLPGKGSEVARGSQRRDVRLFRVAERSSSSDTVSRNGRTILDRRRRWPLRNTSSCSRRSNRS